MEEIEAFREFRLAVVEKMGNSLPRVDDLPGPLRYGGNRHLVSMSDERRHRLPLVAEQRVPEAIDVELATLIAESFLHCKKSHAPDLRFRMSR